MTDEREERIRQKAHMLWEQEGRPQGREAAHWDMATELVAIEDNHALAMTPLSESERALSAEQRGEPVEALENAGEFPTLTDQGEQQIPHRHKPGQD